MNHSIVPIVAPSARWVWQSIRPGRTVIFVRSMILASEGMVTLLPTASILLSRMRMVWFGEDRAGVGVNQFAGADGGDLGERRRAISAAQTVMIARYVSQDAGDSSTLLRLWSFFSLSRMELRISRGGHRALGRA